MLPYALREAVSSAQPEAAVLCRFPHGAPPELSEPSTFSALTFRLLQSTDARDPRKASQRLLTADSARVEWTGKNFAEQSYRLLPYNYAVGVVREEQRSIDLVPVQHVYSMQQHVKHRAVRPSDEAKGGEVNSYAARQKALIDEFGSRKRKSQLASRESNKVVVQREIADVLEGALQANAPSPDEALGDDADDDQALLRKTKRTLLPPFDELTDDPAEIYKLHDLIPKAIYSLLQADAQRLLELAKDEQLLSSLSEAAAAKAGASPAEEKATPAQHELSRLGLHRLQQLTHSEHSSAALHVCTLLSFYHLLLALKLSHPRFPRRSLKSLRHAPHPQVVSHLLDTLTASNPGEATSTNPSPHPNYVIDSTSARRILCYLLVTTLLIGGRRVGGKELGLIGEDLKVGGGELVAAYKEVGCGKASKAEVELTAPLTMGRFRRRKRKSVR